MSSMRSMVPSVPGVSWVLTSNGDSPPNAFVGGRGPTDNNGYTDIYIARAEYGDALIPGKLVPGSSGLQLTFNGEPHLISDYEVLVIDDPNRASWVWKSGRSLPANALPGGVVTDGTILYIGQAGYDGGQTLTPGKIWSGGLRYISADSGQEVLAANGYNVLVVT